MNQNFKSEEFGVLIEEWTFSGSAFGVNEEGDAVFFNARLVNKMDIEVGDYVIAHCIPNYADKRDEVPWRCVRVSQRTPQGFIEAMERD